MREKKMNENLINLYLYLRNSDNELSRSDLDSLLVELELLILLIESKLNDS